MFAEIGQLLLCIALSLSGYYGFQTLYLSRQPDFKIQADLVTKSLIKTVVLVNLLILASFLILMKLFIVSDFSVTLVATHSNALLPTPYKMIK